LLTRQRRTDDVSADCPGDPHFSPKSGGSAITLAGFQQLIREMYLEKDLARGVEGTFMWLMEEVGELASALRSGTLQEQTAEFADVLAWLTTIANVAGVDLAEAVAQKYGSGCPGCGQLVCVCPDAGKP
jgi:NTP pyrophosphatase (non-canonical NTP hydrolase)